MTPLVLIVGLLAGTVVLSLAAEALRPRPQAPQTLYWDPAITIQYALVDGLRIRHIKTGRGPTWCSSTRFEPSSTSSKSSSPASPKALPCTPSTTPDTAFPISRTPAIGPSCSSRSWRRFLIMRTSRRPRWPACRSAARSRSRSRPSGTLGVKNVVSINPYDYGKGMGIRRGNLVARLVFTLAKVPVLGETAMRLRNPLVERWIMEGGVCDPAALTPGFMAQLVASGARGGHYRAFLNLIRHAHLWEDARQVYGQIGIPVLVVDGDRDWSLAEERRRTTAVIPGVRTETVPSGGHFLSLDQPERLAELIKGFA